MLSGCHFLNGAGLQAEQLGATDVCEIQHAV
jgi:hypothetical protein